MVRLDPLPCLKTIHTFSSTLYWTFPYMYFNHHMKVSVNAGIGTTKLFATFALLTFEDILISSVTAAICSICHNWQLPCLVCQQLSLFWEQRSTAVTFVSNKCVYEFLVLVHRFAINFVASIHLTKESCHDVHCLLMSRTTRQWTVTQLVQVTTTRIEANSQSCRPITSAVNKSVILWSSVQTPAELFALGTFGKNKLLRYPLHCTCTCIYVYTCMYMYMYL